ncbi:hypothetical protein F4801DRAFT_546198 [Xylaria longipes]|nr:hypothetical protein F4801DRAFT_546198 [Xylaria longipes]
MATGALFSRGLKTRLRTHHLSHLQQANVFLGHFRPFSTTLRVLHNHIQDVERLDFYYKGGYHPIEIGHRLRGRYRVGHKLGFGTHPTTWLAQDVQQSGYVAVKVATADSDEEEVEVPAQLTDPTVGNEDRGKTMISPVLDYFTVFVPNGTYSCFVSSPRRPDAVSPMLKRLHA